MNPPIFHQWVAGKIPPAAQVLLDRVMQSDDVVRIAVMPDVHAANEICVGTVLATRQLIYPAAVGGDIGCGMAAIAFDANAEVLTDEQAAANVLADLYRIVPSNRHRHGYALPEALSRRVLSDPRLEAMKPRDAAVQFGTLGRGNHFLEFQADEEDRLWLMVHSGSRAVGQAVRDLHVRHANRSRVGLYVLDAATEAGLAYLADATWAAEYAIANRRAMIDAAAGVVRHRFGVATIESTYRDCAHNHVRRESHFDEELWVHRKGATPAALGEAGIIPGSMGTASYHVEGRGNNESLYSSSHGAGRLMSRADARRAISASEFRRQMGRIWYDHRQVDALRDEAPTAYKNLDEVMRAQRDLTRITRKLRPVLCYKGI